MSAGSRDTEARDGTARVSTARTVAAGRVLGWVGVVLVTASGAFAAWLEALLVPYYVGDTLVPVTVALALASSWFLPRLARSLVPTTLAAVLPFLSWLAVIFALAAAGRPEGDVILPGGGGAIEYVGYAVMLGGAVVGTISIVTSTPPPPPRRPRTAEKQTLSR